MCNKCTHGYDVILDGSASCGETFVGGLGRFNYNGKDGLAMLSYHMCSVQARTVVRSFSDRGVINVNMM